MHILDNVAVCSRLDLHRLFEIFSHAFVSIWSNKADIFWLYLYASSYLCSGQTKVSSRESHVDLKSLILLRQFNACCGRTRCLTNHNSWSKTYLEMWKINIQNANSADSDLKACLHLEFFLRFSSSGGCERVNELHKNIRNSSTHSQSSEKENRTKICSKNCNVISTDQILMHCLCWTTQYWLRRYIWIDLSKIKQIDTSDFKCTLMIFWKLCHNIISENIRH